MTAPAPTTGTWLEFFNNLGSKQRDRRVRRFFTDREGRRWFAWADKENQRPIGEFVLADQSGRFQTPPWIPPMSYIRWRDHDALDFAWDYERLADELASVTAEFYGEAMKCARAIKVDIPEIGGPLAPELLGIMGPPPLSPEIPLACLAGEPWLLGRVGAQENPVLGTTLRQGKEITTTLAMDAIKARVAALVAQSGSVYDEQPAEADQAPNYFAFMAQQLQAGKSQSEAQRAWQDRKAVA